MPAFRSVTFRPSRYRLVSMLATCGVVVTTLGCAAAGPATAVVTASAYDIHVQLDPETHGFVGHATLMLHRESPSGTVAGPVVVEFALNRTLNIESLTADGAEVGERSVREPAADEGDEQAPEPLLAIHSVALDAVAETFALTFDYRGVLVQDVAAGERPGEIHNFVMAAHVGPEGVFLDADGGWYPYAYRGPDAEEVGELADYHLTARPVAGMKLVAGAAFDAKASAETGQLVWSSRYPLDGLALVGGPHAVKERQVGDVRLALHYSRPDDAESRKLIERNTDMFLNAAAGYLERYQPLVGDYPGEQFTIVENFFSSGFAFPEFTLLNRRLFQMGPRALMHGYVDHEMLHSWWGNGIYVDPADGNWCEALTSYATNYYGYILDGDEPGARRYRRNACNSFSNMKAEEDQPLGDFGRQEGVGRTIGYNKGAMVFHMLARRIGQENFWAAMRQLTADYVGKYADWQTLQMLFEQHGGVKLDRFFSQWVRESGAPSLSLDSAVWRADDRVLEVTINQGETAFELAVPLQITHEGGTFSTKVVEIDEPVATVRLPFDRPPVSVVVDPDYHVFRRLAPGEMMPTTRLTLAGQLLLVIKPGEDISKFYQTVIERFGARKEAEDVTQCTVDDLPADELAQQSLLILGEAVRSAPVQALLARTNCPITWHESGFDIEGTSYDQPGQSVMCTVHHPDVVGGGITIYCGNSEDALGRSDLLLFYPNSLVVFDTTVKETDGGKQYSSQVILRRDFESPVALEVSGR